MKGFLDMDNVAEIAEAIGRELEEPDDRTLATVTDIRPWIEKRRQLVTKDLADNSREAD